MARQIRRLTNENIGTVVLELGRKPYIHVAVRIGSCTYFRKLEAVRRGDPVPRTCKTTIEFDTDGGTIYCVRQLRLTEAGRVLGETEYSWRALYVEATPQNLSKAKAKAFTVSTP